MRRRTKGPKRTGLRLGAGTAVAGALLLGDPGIASAEIRYAHRTEEFSFGQRPYTCTFEFSSYASSDLDSAGAQSVILRDRSDPICFEDYHQVFVTASYTDVSGQRERVTAHSEENVILELSDFGSGLVVEHYAVFAICRCETPVYRTAPK